MAVPSGRLHFIWALPGPPVPIPDNWTCRRVRAADGVMVQTSGVETGLQALLLPDFLAQARYHQVTEAPTATAALHTALDVATAVLPDLQRGSSPPAWAPYRFNDGVPERSASVGADRSALTSGTVVHIATAVHEDPSSDDVASAFDEALDLVHTTYRAVYTRLGVALQLPTAESTNSFSIVVGFEVVSGQTRQPIWPLGFYATNHVGLVSVPKLSDDDLRHLEHAELQDATHHPTMLAIDLRRQAIAAAHRTGDTRTAVVMAATACETLIDIVLNCLMWEEGHTPESAAAELAVYRETLPRLLRLLGPRLGGSWDIEKVAELRIWRKVVADGRNRVVHLGGLPTPHLADSACDAMLGFGRLILDRLCAARTRNRYPMTCLIVATRSGLEPRGGWTRRIRDAIVEADKLDAQGVFARWYDVVNDLRLPRESDRLPSETRAIVNAVVLASGQTYWVQRDDYARAARLASPVVDVRDLERHARQALATADHPGITVSFDMSPAVRPAGPWLPAYRLLPGVAVLRDPASWYAPPDAPPSAHSRG